MTTKKTGANAPKKKPVNATPELEFFVAPRNGKAGREVVVRHEGVEFTDVVNPIKASAREAFARRAAEKFGIEDQSVLAGWCDRLAEESKKADEAAERMARELAAKAPAGGDRSAKALAETPAEVLAAAEAFLKNPDLMAELDKDLRKLGIAGEEGLAKTLYLVAISRKLARTLGASVKASSSSGKSFVTEAVITLLPPEDVLQATNITPNALYYLTPGFLVHKLVVVGERPHASAGDQAEAANATLALREMLSRGRLDKFVPMKSADGGIQTQHITQEGPIAYLETTTQQEIFEEDATRMLTLSTDESPAQTKAIMQIQARQAAWESASPDEQEAIRLKHRAAQRLLKPMKVRIPYAGHLVLPESKLIARRAFPQLLGFIEAVALLRQFKKTKKHREAGYVVATVADYEIAHALMVPVLRRAFTPFSERAKNLLVAILNNNPLCASFSRSDCAKWAGVGLTEVRNRLAVLVEAGLVEQQSGGKGVSYAYKVVMTKPDHPGLSGLIKPKALRKLLAKPKSKKATKKASGSPPK